MPEVCYEVIKEYFFDETDACNHYEGGCHCRVPPARECDNNHDCEPSEVCYEVLKDYCLNDDDACNHEGGCHCRPRDSE